MSRPPIVLIVLDDTHPDGWAQMPYLQSLIAADKVVDCSNGFFDFSLCGTSRTTIDTGRRADHHGTYYHGDSGTSGAGSLRAWDLAADGGPANMLGAWMRAAGYQTVLLGKYVNKFPFARGDNYVPAGWDWFDAFLDDSSRGGAHAAHTGPDYFDYWMALNGGAPVFYGSVDNWTGVGAVSSFAGRTASTTNYSTDVLNLKARSWLNTQRNPDKPFFLKIATRATHNNDDTLPQSINVASRHAAQAFTASRSASFNEDARRVTTATVTNGSSTLTGAFAFTSVDIGAKVSGSGIPAATSILSVTDSTHATMSNNANATFTGNGDIAISNNLGFSSTNSLRKPQWLRTLVPQSLTTAQLTAMDVHQKNKWRTLQAVDELIRDLVTTLTALGLWSDTKLLVATDNGVQQLQHRLGQLDSGVIVKGFPYTDSMATHLFVRDPTISAGRVESTAMVSNVDIAATVLDYADALRCATVAMDGISLKPLIQGAVSPSAFRNEHLFHWKPPPTTGAGSQIPTFYGIRTSANHPTWPSMQYVDLGADGSGGAAAEVEMYDLSTDPECLRNVINDGAYTAAKTDLARRLAILIAA